MPTTVERDEAKRWLLAFAGRLDDETVDRLAIHIHQEILAAVPELAQDADVSRDTFNTVHAGIESFVDNVVAEPWQAPVVPPALIAFARTLARRRSDLSVLLKAYRYGQNALWRHVMVACERDVVGPEVQMRVLLIAHERLARWIEVLIEHQVSLYQEERDRWLRGALARRADTIRALLAGDDLDPDEASRILAYDLRCHHTALALWAPVASGSAHGRLDTLAGELASALGAGRALTLPSGEQGLWAWIGTHGAPPADALGAALRELGADGLRMAVGRPAPGIVGFKESHREAVDAQRVAVAISHERPLTRYDDVEMLCLLSKDPEAMRALVRRELGPLAAGDGATERLRETVRVFLEGGCSARTAATTLGTHKNTVLYRLRRVEEMLGAPLQERRPGLDLALMLTAAFGDDVLGAGGPPPAADRRLYGSSIGRPG